MSRRKQKQTDSEKLDLILEAVTTANEKIDSQNERIEALQKEVHATKKLVDDMARKNRRDAVIAGGVGGGIIAVGFELLRLKFGM
ncbi:hypothetical protein Q7Z55_05175 [Glaesserella parasuis]|uniref:hypothetical protein n=1 Tax=Glaesserella parasuis TaxID=738 RepID=UPI0003AC0EA3|nr:hypothetical protein [Glaesserella parasuis]ATW46345.1 hypothetical protein A2U21_10650 [Glaesserella parasuis str. Nagasaki]EPZ99644.1 hypothetical protein HPSNAG_1976 [Glaesserella parasuis str. Nagasaki]EYE72087.1 hypothetical protein HPNK_06715 [Glaesserella parasuis str. Nagasaki]MDP0069002.1 hypothetical protein [Glaesserella parasuis]MDP0244842.1 hypothetical protein [Glaesserella parasuis]